jgi:hypothetical protein
MGSGASAISHLEGVLNAHPQVQSFPHSLLAQQQHEEETNVASRGATMSRADVSAMLERVRDESQFQEACDAAALFEKRGERWMDTTFEGESSLRVEGSGSRSGSGINALDEAAGNETIAQQQGGTTEWVWPEALVEENETPTLFRCYRAGYAPPDPRDVLEGQVMC